MHWNIWRHAAIAMVLAASPSLNARERALTEASSSKQTLTIPRLDHPPKLEDFLAMKPAPGAPPMSKVDGFIQHDPKDGAPAQQKTEVYIGYDARNFYAVFVCFDDQPSKLRARMARREDIGPDHDEVQIYLDTFNDQRRAYGFMINPLGIQYDFIWTESGGADPSWDTVWESRGQLTAHGYVALMAIPFKSLRFSPAKEQTWGILFQRVVPHDNDNSFYPHVSASVQGRLSQEAEVSGLANIRSGRNIQLVPYGLSDAYRALDQRDPSYPFFTGKHLAGRAGVDGKFIVKDSLVLDFTVNPDFRQLESDQPQNTTNQRFELFFPEKRPFFQEGANYFDTPINMYFTRRIEDPQFGVRLSGKLGAYGIGLLAADDRSPGQSVPVDDPLSGKRAFFAIGRITRELWNRSQVGLFYSDREMSAVANSLCSNNALTTAQQIECVSHANRVGGADFTFHFADHLQVQGQALTSNTDEIGGVHHSGNLFFLYAQYSTRHVEYDLNLRDVSPGFVTLPGFYQRPDIRRVGNYLGYMFRPEGKVLTSWGPHMYERTTYDHVGNQLEAVYEPGFEVQFKQNTNINFFGGSWQELLKPSDYSTLTHNTNFNKGGYAGVIINTNYLKWISLSANLYAGKNLNFDPPAGQSPFLANETQATLNATTHPLTRLTIANDYLLERLTSRTSHAAVINAHIIRSKFNYQYNKELSFRAIFQYDALLANPLYTSLSQTKNFNADFLITYLIHPGTAFYIGYNSNLQNLDPFAISAHTGLVRNNRFINDGRTIYAKISYLFRF